jgi:hypothetical protein
MTKSSGKPMALPHCSECIYRRKTDDLAKVAEFLDGVKTPIEVDE